MEKENDDPEFTRPPVIADLVKICRDLNERGARYLVVGGMAVNIHGYVRNTEDIDLLIETSEENESIIFDSLSSLPEGVAKDLRPGEVNQYTVVRICDEITVDLMAKACGLRYNDRPDFVTMVVIQGVGIPFASPKFLWLTKQTYREKDEIDRMFLRDLLMDRNEWPVEKIEAEEVPEPAYPEESMVGKKARTPFSPFLRWVRNLRSR